MWGGGVGFPARITGHMTRGSTSGAVCLWNTRVTTGYDQQAGGTHPTGMHSCFENKFNVPIHLLIINSHLFYLSDDNQANFS